MKPAYHSEAQKTLKYSSHGCWNPGNISPSIVHHWETSQTTVQGEGANVTRCRRGIYSNVCVSLSFSILLEAMAYEIGVKSRKPKEDRSELETSLVGRNTLQETEIDCKSQNN
jgi:hypothetical protein